MKPDPIALDLSRILSVPSARGAMAPVLARVEKTLSARPDQRQAWEPIPLRSLGFATPEAVRSCWVFVLRSGAIFGPERHPNSHQRTIALSGAALFEILMDESWSPWPVSSIPDEPGATSAISIAPSVWHRIRVGPETFVSVSFHTAPAEELIEETPIGDDLSTTIKRVYHA